MSATEVRNCTDRIEAAVREAAGTLDYIGPEGLSSPAEVADCAWDQLEETCYLTPAEEAEVYAAITREVYGAFGIASGASDGSDITAAQLAAVAAKAAV
jgi:hypothetical protein